jgi:hypothetical protein
MPGDADEFAEPDKRIQEGVWRHAAFSGMARRVRQEITEFSLVDGR